MSADFYRFNAGRDYFDLVKSIESSGKKIAELPNIIEKKLSDVNMGVEPVDSAVDLLMPYLVVTGLNPYKKSGEGHEGVDPCFEASLIRYDSKFGKKIRGAEMTSVEPDFYNVLRENADVLLSHHAQIGVNRRLDKSINALENEDVWNRLLYGSENFSNDYDTFLSGLNPRVASSYFGAPSVDLVQESLDFYDSTNHVVLGGESALVADNKNFRIFHMLNDLHEKTNYGEKKSGYLGFDVARKLDAVPRSNGVYTVGALKLTPGLELTTQSLKENYSALPSDSSEHQLFALTR